MLRSIKACSVEVLVPWQLRGVELWPDGIDEEVQHELEGKLGVPERCKWKGDWVERHYDGHHDVDVKGQSFISN